MFRKKTVHFIPVLLNFVLNFQVSVTLTTFKTLYMQLECEGVRNYNNINPAIFAQTS